jgi:prepilin-type processing-associated H-X9-DG protein/prepilin-type N-terminal cleavage/methylation domain-containing protein
MHRSRRGIAISAKPSTQGLRCGYGFTLVEILISISIIAVLMALLIPAVRGAVGAARGFKCQMSLRSVAFDFGLFANDQLHGSRGNDDADPQLRAAGQFRLETFQNLEYNINEFWSYGNVSSITLPDPQGRDPMRCAAVKGDITLRRNIPCTSGGVGPAQNISYGFNIRMHWSERQARAGRPAGVLLTGRILDNAEVPLSSIPLLWDIDGRQAASRGVNPVFSGPSLNSQLLFAGNQYWFPGLRHNGGCNAAFIDGHVESTRAPLDQTRWAWGYDPGR